MAAITSDRYYELQAQVAKSNVRKDVFEAHIQPFISEQEQRLFQAFCGTPANDVESLRLIKMQHTVLLSLKNSFLTDIENGKLAEAELKQKAGE